MNELRSRNHVSTPQPFVGLTAASTSMAFVVSVLALSCTPPAQSLPSMSPMLAVVAARSESDQVSILVDGQTQSGQWYCSPAPAPQTYEVMFSDASPRGIRAIGIVAGNLGPDGIGAVRVRVQHGHGVMADGVTYRAVPRGVAGRVQLVVLPRTIEGDHVVLTFERRSRFATALCLGEITTYGEDYPRDAYRIDARPAPSEAPPSSDEPPSSAPPTASSPLTSGSPAPSNGPTDGAVAVDASASPTP